MAKKVNMGHCNTCGQQLVAELDWFAEDTEWLSDNGLKGEEKAVLVAGHCGIGGHNLPSRWVDYANYEADEDGWVLGKPDELYLRDENWSFVDDIDWEGEAERRGVVLAEAEAIGYSIPDPRLMPTEGVLPGGRERYAAKLVGGGALVWEDGDMEVLSPERFEDECSDVIFP